MVTKTVTGTTSITGGITFTNEGTITTTTSATLDFGALLLADGSSITGPGIVRLLNGNLGFEPNAITSLGAGATLNLTGTAILSGTGTFGGAGRFDWSGGTIAGNLTIDTDSTMLIRGGAVKLLRGNNAGTAGILNIADGAAVEWSDSGNLEFQDQATINNGGLFTAKNSQNLAYVSGNQGRFNNLAGGTFTKESGGTTFVTGGLRFANSGTVHASTPDAILDFQLLEAANGGTFTGAGIHRVTGLIEIAGTTNLATGTVMELAGGTLQGTGAFAGNGHLSWISGTILGSPTIASGSTMLIGGNGSKLLQGNNSGTNGILNIESGASVIWTGSGNIAMQDFAIIRNNGVFDSRDDHSFNYAGGSAPLFSNLSGGKLLKSGGSGGTAFGGSIAVENAGTVQAVSGTLAFNSGYTQTGGLTRLNGGAIATGGTIALQGGTLTGVGIIVGNVTNAATIEPGNNGTGILSITGNYSQTNTGRLSVEIGGTAAGTGFDQLAVGSTTTLGGTLNIAYAAGFTPDEDQQFQVVASTNNPGLFASITGETALSQSAGAAGLTLLTSVTSPDLLLTSDNGVTATTPGSQLSYTLNYRNDSPQAADGVQLTQTLPAGSTFNAAASTSGWVETTAGSGVFRLFIGTLAGGAAGTATFAVVVDSIAAAGREQLTSTASIADDGDNGADPTPANNSAIDSDILTAAPDLVLVKTDQHTATTPGSILSYTLDYRNDGNQDATGVILTETLPAGTRFNAAASSQGWIETAPGSGIFTLNKGTLGGGMAGSAIFAVTVDTPALAGRDLILAGASIADDGTNGSDTAPANNLATDSNILDAAPDLQLSKSNNVTVTTPGSPLSYTLNYRNDGDQGATGVRLTETLPLGTTFNAAASTPGWVETAPGVFTLEVGALAGGGANGSATFAINVNATVASGLDTLSSSATISDDGTNGAEPTPANNTATDIDTLDAAPELAVTSSDALTTTTPGSLVTYTIAYRNDGNQDAKGVVLTKLLPAGTTFNPAASTPGWSESVPGVFTLNVDALAAGGTGGGAIFAVTVNAPAPAGLDVISSTAIIGDDGQNGADPVPANNAAPDLKISVSDAAGVAKRGGTTRYTLTYNNQGNQDASGVFLFETLPANSTFNSAQSSPGWVETAPNSGVYRFEIGNLAAGAAGGTATFAIKLAQTLPAGFLGLAPTASIDDDRANGVDPDGFNNTAAIITPIYQGVYIVAPGVGVPRGATPVVRVFDIASGNQSFAFSAYESTYRGGVRLAVGDFNGDGVDDIITSTRLGTGRIRIFDGVDGEQLAGPFGELNAFSGRAARGAFVASGDVNGDGRDDLIVGSGRGGGTVQVYDGLTAQLLNTYTPFGSKFKGGVRVAVGDVDGNGTEDIVLSQGDSGSRVQVYSGATTTVLHDFKAAPKSHRTGIFVAAADIDGDGKADIIAGRDIRSAAIVESFSGVDHHSISRIVAFGQAYRNGVRVAATDVNFDGIADIIATSGTKGGSQVKIFDGRSGSELPGFSAFPDFPDVSLFAAATTRVPSVAAVGILP